MDARQFKPSAPGTLITAGSHPASYLAFVPTKLPPELDLDLDLVAALSDADRALGQLAGLGHNIPNPHLLLGPFIRREAVLSSRIEGTLTEVTDLYAYEAGQGILPGIQRDLPEADVREVLNYVTALEYGLDRLATLPVSLRLMRELHERLMRGVRGEHATPGLFRTSQNWIEGLGPSDALYVPPPKASMAQCLGDLEAYFHSGGGHPPLIRLAFVHYQLEAIHPFVDGNGRIGRLLNSLLMVHWELLPLPLLYLSEYFERNRVEYFSRLHSVTTEGAWTQWVTFYLTGVRDQALRAALKVKQLQELQADWRARLTKARSSALLLRMPDLLFERPIVTIPQVSDSLGVGYKSAAGAVDKLLSAGILVPANPSATYAKAYLAVELMDIVRSPS